MTHGQKVRNWILKAFEKEYPEAELISYTAEKHKIFSSYNVVINAESATENMVVHMSIYPDNPRGQGNDHRIRGRGEKIPPRSA